MNTDCVPVPLTLFCPVLNIKVHNEGVLNAYLSHCERLAWIQTKLAWAERCSSEHLCLCALRQSYTQSSCMILQGFHFNNQIIPNYFLVFCTRRSPFAVQRKEPLRENYGSILLLILQLPS